MRYTNYKEYINRHLSPKRITHSFNTADSLIHHCDRFVPSITKEDAFFVGVMHDCCRWMSDEDLLHIATKHHISMERVEQDNPMLLHGAVASILLPTFKDPIDPKWQVAIRWHTLAHKEMGPLGAALYVADYIEVGRTFVSLQERETIIKLSSLEEMTLHILKNHISYIQSRAKVVSNSTNECKLFLKEGGVFE